MQQLEVPPRIIEKLVRAGEQAGIRVEDMIRVLNAGVPVEILLGLIELKLFMPLNPVHYHIARRGGESPVVIRRGC